MEDSQSSVAEAEKPEKETQEIKDHKGDPQAIYALDEASQDIDNLLSRLSVQIEISDFVDKYLDLVDEKICSHESVLEDDGSFLELVNQISKLYRNLSDSGSDHGALINRIGKIQQRAMCYLEDEFMSLLEESEASDQSGEDQSADLRHSGEEQNYPGSLMFDGLF